MKKRILTTIILLLVGSTIGLVCWDTFSNRFLSRSSQAYSEPILIGDPNLFKTGNEHYLKGEYVLAEKCWHDNLSKEPKDVATLQNLGLLYVKNGSYDEAKTMFLRSNEITNSVYSKNYITVFHVLDAFRQNYELAGRDEEALEIFEWMQKIGADGCLKNSNSKEIIEKIFDDNKNTQKIDIVEILMLLGGET